MSIFFGSVGPDDFARNYAAWARAIGLSSWAEYLAIYATAPRVFWGAVLISLVYLSVAFIIPALVTQAKRNASAITVPVAVAIIIAFTAIGQYAISYPAERHVSEYQRKILKDTGDWECLSGF